MANEIAIRQPVPHEDKMDLLKPYQKKIVEMIEEGARDGEIVRLMEAEWGVTISRSAVHQWRTKEWVIERVRAFEGEDTQAGFSNRAHRMGRTAQLAEAIHFSLVTIDPSTGLPRLRETKNTVGQAMLVKEFANLVKVLNDTHVLDKPSQVNVSVSGGISGMSSKAGIDKKAALQEAMAFLEDQERKKINADAIEGEVVGDGEQSSNNE